MNERDAFVRRICEEPDDDTVRLVFADWLQEHGEPEWAEFIRVQVQLSTFDSSYYLSYDNRALCERSMVPLVAQSALLLHPAWSGQLREQYPITIDINDCEFRRGFWKTVRLPLAAFMEQAATIFRTHPVTRVVLTDRSPLVGVGGLCFWSPFRLSDPSPAYPQRIPGDVFECIDNDVNLGEDNPLRFKHYSTYESAMDALSDGCVAYGRSLVNLPPLPARSSGTAARSH